MALIGLPPRRNEHTAVENEHIDPKIPAKQKRRVPRHIAVEAVELVDPAVVATPDLDLPPAVGRDEFRVLLGRAGFKQSSFAGHIDVHIKTVSRWALGTIPVPRLVVMYLELYLARGERGG